MKHSFRALVIDDDREMRESLEHLLFSGGFEVDLLAGADKAVERLAKGNHDVILCDVKMPGMSGMDLLNILTPETHPPMVLISAHGDIPTAVQAMQNGAYTFLEKPFDPRRLLKALENAAAKHRLYLDAARLRAQLGDLSGLDRVLIGNTPQINALRDEIIDLSASITTVMVLGDTGTGKELVARAIHNLGPRVGGPFVALNCAAIPLDKFEEILFGVSGGAPGVLQQSDGGTLFLDELGAMPREAQAKLLRSIETREFTPLGGASLIHADFRLISASNTDLGAEVASGKFREDLYFRLNTVVVNLPPLRDRREDIPLLFAHFLEHFAPVYEVVLPELTSEDLAALMVHDWPGNVRELRNVAERRVLAARRGLGSVAESISTVDDGDEVPETLREAVAAFERQLIGKAIATHQGRMDAVAEALGIGRRTLNEKIVKLGLDKTKILES